MGSNGINQWNNDFDFVCDCCVCCQCCCQSKPVVKSIDSSNSASNDRADSNAEEGYGSYQSRNQAII